MDYGPNEFNAAKYVFPKAAEILTKRGAANVQTTAGNGLNDYHLDNY